MGIIHIDMHIRDERVLEYLRAKCDQKEMTILQDEIAAVFGCHRHTAAAILQRLEYAGKLRRHVRAKRLGYAYEVMP